MKLTTFITLSGILTIIACSKLQIKNFPLDNNPLLEPLLTAQINYQRNTYSAEEINPPLRENWEIEYKALPINGFTVTNQWLLFGAANGDMVVVDLDTGLIIGKKRLGGTCAGPPTVYKNILYQTYETGSYGLVAYDIVDGERLWRIENHLSHSSPLLIDNRVYLQSKDGKIVCYNYLTGEKIWDIIINLETKNSMAYQDNLLISAGLDGKITALEFTSGVVIWQKLLSTPIFADPVIHGENLYIASHDGSIFIFDVYNGKLIQKLKFEIPIYYAPTIDKTNIYIPLSDGRLIVIDNSSYETKWSFKGNGPISSSPLVTKSYIYLTTLAQQFFIIDKTNGSIIQEIELEGRVRSTPIIIKNKLVMSCENDKVVFYVEDN